MSATALGAFTQVTVGVSSLDAALGFWTGHFGFQVHARRAGADAAAAALWGLPAAEIVDQAIVGTPGARAGRLHLVEFAHPGAPVRRGARSSDQLPKNLDVYVRDMAQAFNRLRSEGVEFRGEPLSTPGPDGLVFREVHLCGHDATNVVLIEVAGAGYAPAFSPAGCAGIGPLVTIVPDLAREAVFYQGILGLTRTLALQLGGPAIEKMIGLPAGAALGIEVYGDPSDPLGRIEVIEYQGAGGANLFPRARPPALGTLHVAYRVASLAPLLEGLRAAAVPLTDHGPQQLLWGAGRVVSLCSPAGFRIEVQEAQDIGQLSGSGAA
jgi:catechol 2,3-dioxygenase-like lactoylglutathione lyase family enzyme